MKKVWKRPELIVLLKGQSQEAVLTHCKTVSIAGLPTLLTAGQYCGNDKADSCQNCKARAGS